MLKNLQYSNYYIYKKSLNPLHPKPRLFTLQVLYMYGAVFGIARRFFSGSIDQIWSEQMLILNVHIVMIPTPMELFNLCNGVLRVFL